MLEFARPDALNGTVLNQELAASGLPLSGENEVKAKGDVLVVEELTEDHRATAQDVIDAHVPPPPPPDPDVELANAITNVRDNAANDDVKSLCDALLGNLSQGRAAGRSP